MAYLNSKIFKIVSEEAAALGLKAFVIGGYVRDSLMERECKDIDIVVDGSGIELAQRVSERTKTTVAIFKNFGTAMLKWRGLEIEFVGARKESYRADSRKPIVEDGSLEEDQRRRDFTINAMAFSLQQEDFGALSDPFNGKQDLADKLIRTPLDPDTTYADDPLRMFRAIRFASQLSFTIVPESIDSIGRNRERIKILSAERIIEELNKIILSPKPSVGLYLLESTGLLAIFFPQLINLRGVESVEGRGHKDNFAHTLQVLDNVAEKSNDLWLRWAALLHDIGKPATKSFEPGTGWTFHAHDFVGAKMVPKIFKQLKLPLNEKMKYVQKLVQLHLRPISLVQEDVTDSAIRRLLFDAGDDIDDLMLLCQADITSKNEYTVKKHKNNFLLVRQKLVEVEEKDAVRNFKNPITGEMIMERYNLPPCSEIGLIKERIKNAILDGAIGNNLEEATKLMEKVAVEVLSKHPRNQ
jgi:uncharacterized domain HDIG